MHIQKVRVEGFRLLQDVEIMLEPGSTVIVGRNNSGKTSLTGNGARTPGMTATMARRMTAARGQTETAVTVFFAAVPGTTFRSGCAPRPVTGTQ
jgi:ABC-type hemin transport system ATPase subunit